MSVVGARPCPSCNIASKAPIAKTFKNYPDKKLVDVRWKQRKKFESRTKEPLAAISVITIEEAFHTCNFRYPVRRIARNSSSTDPHCSLTSRQQRKNGSRGEVPRTLLEPRLCDLREPPFVAKRGLCE